MRGPNRVARVRDAFLFFGFGLRRSARTCVTRAFRGYVRPKRAPRRWETRAGAAAPPSRAPPRAARARASVGASEASSRPAARIETSSSCLLAPSPARSPAPRLGRSAPRARARAVALVADGALNSRVLGARVWVLGGVPRAPPRARPGSLAPLAPPVAVMAARASCATSRARGAPRRAPRGDRGVRRTHGAHTIGRSGICGVREVGSKVSARGRGGGTGERECSESIIRGRGVRRRGRPLTVGTRASPARAGPRR